MRVKKTTKRLRVSENDGIKGKQVFECRRIRAVG